MENNQVELTQDIYEQLIKKITEDVVALKAQQCDALSNISIQKEILVRLKKELKKIKREIRTSRKTLKTEKTNLRRITDSLNEKNHQMIDLNYNFIDREKREINLDAYGLGEQKIR